MNEYIFKAIKDIDFLMEGTMHIFAESKRKAKKSFKKIYRQWTIKEIKIKFLDENGIKNVGSIESSREDSNSNE